ncbi:MAG: hypothetical protein JF625_18010 [Inquilinus limosus]|uniref:Uncharacterized protein n=1 Tax=Inquilinus limosus TaxID=171674 RepID=A0A952KEZ7_9PROT|nr:hypothetical protein [Inquilinus limosus]
MRQVGISRIATAGGAALLLLALAGPAAAAVDLGNLSADDMRALQRILETERTNAPKRLPSGLSVTVVQTRTSPRVCRIFRIGRQGQENQAVGCRIGAQRWALNASIDVAQAAPVDPSPEQPVARPQVVAQSRPVQNPEDEGVEEAGAAPEAPARRSAQTPDAGRAPAETQVAALPRAPFRAPKPLARPDAPDVAAPAAAGPTQAPVPRARPTPGGAAPAATASVPAVAPVVEIDPSLRVLTSPPAAPPPRLRPGSSRPAAVAAAPAEPPPVPAAPAAASPVPSSVAEPPAPAASPIPNPATPNPVALAPAPKGPESLINVPPAAFAPAPAVETLLPRAAAVPVAPAPFAVPPPRVRPEVAAAHPAQGLAPPATRPIPPGAADVPVPRRRPG